MYTNPNRRTGAGQALLDDAYRRGMCEYGETLEGLVQGIWEREYLGGK